MLITYIIYDSKFNIAIRARQCNIKFQKQTKILHANSYNDFEK